MKNRIAKIFNVSKSIFAVRFRKDENFLVRGEIGKMDKTDKISKSIFFFSTRPFVKLKFKHAKKFESIGREVSKFLGE